MTLLTIPLTTGTVPTLDGSIDYAKLVNLHVTAEDRVSDAPFFKLSERLHHPQGVYHTLGNAITLVVANNVLYVLNARNNFIRVSTITVQTQRIEFAENLKNEVLLCTGATAYLYNTQTQALTDLQLIEGFDIRRPVSCTMINSYFIVADGDSNRWQISSANDGLQWTPLNEALLTTASTKIQSVDSISNNLFIIGNNAIERWVPQETVLDFPFSRDNNYRFGWGAFNTEAISAYQDRIVFLSSQCEVMILTAGGVKPLSTLGMDKRLSKIAKSEHPVSVLFKHQGQLFYSLSTQDENWLFSFASQRWSNSTDSLLQWNGDSGFLLQDGFYVATDEVQPRAREFKTGWLTLPRRVPYNPVVNRVSLNVIRDVSKAPQAQELLYLSLAHNHARFGNRVPLPLPERLSNAQPLHWSCNAMARELMLKLDYFGSSKLTLTDLSVDIH